jgi:hypothetical protein
VATDQAVDYERVPVGVTVEELHDALSSLLAQAGLPRDFELQPLEGGANNRIFSVDLKGSRVCLKAYFYHCADPRDRVGAEFAFARFAWSKGVRALPQPLACDLRNRLALYEYIAGRQLQAGEVTEDVVQQALEFYREVNRYKNDPQASALPKASEPCFSVAGHLQRVGYRVGRLLAVEDSSAIHREAIRFVRSELSEAWQEVVESVRREADQLAITPEEEIPQSDWRLSPSDFGFHNAILAADGKLRFIDFEYAGWDDPDRLVCDFFCQPAVPVPLEYYATFAERVAAELSEPENHVKRMTLLLPIYQVKWCCILLNDFLPTSFERRRFAKGTADQDKLKEQQLSKAREALKRLQKRDGRVVVERIA